MADAAVAVSAPMADASHGTRAVISGRAAEYFAGFQLLAREPSAVDPAGSVDDMAATAMIDRVVHYSAILSLKGDSYRLGGKDLDTRIGAKPAEIG